MNVNRLVSFDVYCIPVDCSEPYVLTLPPDVALHLCAYADGAILKLVPNYVSSLPDTESKE